MSESHPNRLTDPESDAAVASVRTASYWDLFLISFVILFFELTCIRWFGSTVVFLSFFTNLVLIACFLGMSVGCLAASRKQNYINFVLPLSLVAVLSAILVLILHERFGQILVDVGNQGSPQQIYFGTEYRARNPGSFVVPIEVLAGGFFALIALIFVGLGQELGRGFDALPNRVAAYSANVLGSLVGIVAFGYCSWMFLPPSYWFLISIFIILRFLRIPKWELSPIIVSILLLFAVSHSTEQTVDFGTETIWSPYNKVVYNQKSRMIRANNITHQQMVDLEKSGSAYMLPYLLSNSGADKTFDEVMIIGAGSGNDVQAALMSKVGHIDAVEIDPLMNRIGRADHPNKPFDQTDKVAVFLDDGRSFIKKTQKNYDLVTYALVDSLVLHSGYSSLRLESYLFTRQAFQDIKKVLKPDGTFVMYNFYRQSWVVGRLAKLAEEVFGTKPLIFTLPYREKITEEGDSGGGFTFLMIGGPENTLIPKLRERFAKDQYYWMYVGEGANGKADSFGPESPNPTIPGVTLNAKDWRKIGPAAVDTDMAVLGHLPADDWPFLYLKEASIPTLNLRGMGIILVLSLIILFAFAPVREFRPNGRMFFLGAGFMLLETKGVVHMALLFGSTWMVNSIVFFAILVMVLLSNLFVLAFKPKILWPYYLLLAIGLLVNVLVPIDTFLALPASVKVVASCAVVFIPMAFAGVVFAASFRDSTRPDADFGWNIAGVILGGLSENLSLMFGFNALIWLAIGYYALSAVLRPRLPAPVPSIA